MIKIGVRATLCALFVCSFMGCSASPYEGRTAKVSGKVSLDGSPISVGNVLFMMEDGHAASCPIGADGFFATECRPGKYKVAVSPPELIDPLSSGGGNAARVAIPNRFQDLGTSGLSVELKAGDNTYDIPLAK